MKRSWLKCVLLLAVLAVGFAAQAQQTASIHGLVTDPDAAVVPGATVTATGTDGKSATTQTKGDGSYSIGGLSAGTYSVTITMAGFASYVKTGIRVAAGQSLSMDAKMIIASEATEVNVTTQTNQVSVDADSNASATVIKDKDLDALSDDPDELQSQLSALAGPSAGPNGGQIYVDGFTGGTLPPKSSIREIRVNQNPFSAQYERLGFGRVEVLTRPGTDKYRGNVGVQGNQKWMNTNSPFVSNQPDYHTFFLQGGLSGPVTKKSSFNFNGNYRSISDNNIISNATIYATNVNDPSTICAPGTVGCTTGTYSSAITHPQSRWSLNPRFDYAISDKNTLIVRYQHEQGTNKNNGIGNFILQSRGQDSTSSEDTIQISDSQIFSAKLINETRFEWQRSNSTATAQNFTPSITVTGAFSNGGSSTGNSNTTDTHYEVQNYTSVALQKHFIRAGGRLRYTSENQYSIAGSNGSFTYASIADYIAGRVNQYSISKVNQLTVNNNVFDIGLYAEDDYKLRPNLTLSAGIRLETQNQINSARDIAPRLSIAWGVTKKTVFRAGYGIFYDRFDLAQVMNVTRLNGTNVVTTTVQAASPTTGIPGCSPNNVTGCTGGSPGRATIYTIGNTRSAYTMQLAAGVDQSIGKIASISINYLNARGVHQYLNRAFRDTVANSLTYRYDSGGVFNQNQLFFNGNVRLNSAVSLFGFYSLNYAKGNASGATFTPSRATDTKADYGRTSFDTRNRMLLAGNISFKHGISASPFLMANSGSPYNITAGQDVNGDGNFNDRPVFANGVNGSCTSASTFALPGSNLQTYQQIPIYYCTGPASLNFNMRLAKTFGFGEKTGGPAAGGGRQRQGGPGGFGGAPGGGGGRGGPGGGGPGGPGGPFGGGGNSGHKYTATFAVQANNLLNVVNYGTPVGTITSPQFGKSNSLGGGGFMGPGGSSNAVRRITLQLNFNF